LCESHIQIKDISEAIDKLKPNKSPGNYGFTTEFYKKFSNIFSQFLLQVYLESLHKGTLPSSMTQGVINLIPASKGPPST